MQARHSQTAIAAPPVSNAADPWPMASAVLLMCLFLVTAPPWAQGSADPGHTGEIFVHEDLRAAEPLRLEWVEIPGPASEFRAPTAVLQLRAVSLSDEELRITARWSGDNGGEARWGQSLEERVLRPHGEVVWSIAPESAGMPMGGTGYSGQLIASASATKSPDSSVGGEVSTHVYASQVFFHRSSEKEMRFYGAEILRDRYASGDLEGKLPPLDFGRLERVTRGGGSVTGPEDLASNERRICLRWQVGVTDGWRKAKTAEGELISEDFWVPSLGPDDIVPPGYDPTTFEVTAHGVRVMLIDGDSAQTFDADPVTGCFTFSGEYSDQVLLVAFGHSTDVDGNVIRVGIGLPSGMIFAYLFGRLVDTPAPTEELTIALGNYSAEATLVAISAFTSNRQNFGLSNKEIRIRQDGSCGGPGLANSSAHFDASGLSQGIAQVRIHDGTGTVPNTAQACSGSDMRRWKFLVGHEMGHAWLLLATGKNSFEPWVDANLCDSTETVCIDTGPGYSIGSLEWSSLAVREGIAHFYATWVWNRPQSPTGILTWFGGPFEVEADDTAETGGRLELECDSEFSPCGRGTILDWLRFFWDWHTPYSAGKPSMETIRDIYVRHALDHFDGNAEITKINNYYRLREAMHAEVASPTQRQAWDDFAALNGIDTSWEGVVCEGPDFYPGCSCWTDRCAPMPESCKGEIGCPCVDIDLGPGFDLFHLGEDGTYPDGEGSYAANGIEDGPGQFCGDAKGEAVCGLRTVEGREVPTCERCGIDTHLGCECTLDQHCQGLDDEPLRCWRSPADGWGGSQPGICLPNDITPSGRDRLTELPWFCLDNCGSKGSSSRCIFDQLKGFWPGYVFEDARCVDVACSLPVGTCESEGRVCYEHEGQDICVDECQFQTGGDGDAFGFSCGDWNFPDFYACEFEPIGTENGHCLPPLCANSKNDYLANKAYCDLFW